MNSKVTRIAAVIIILLAASYTIGVLNNQPETAAKTEVVAEVERGSLGAENVTPEFLKKFNEVKRLYAADDIDAIVKLLGADDMAVRMIAAEFLGKTADIEAAKVLEKLSGEQSNSVLADKFIVAAKSIRGNAEAEVEQGEAVEDKGQLGGVDANGVGLTAPATEKGFFLLKVIDKETKRPITNLNICAQVDVGYDYYKTGDDWFCKVKLTKPKFGYFSVGVQVDGYASARFVKDTDNQDYVVPLEYTIEMEKGVYVGGYLENEKGQKLAGYKVKIKCERKNTEIDRTYADTEVFCDANGMWKCNAVPAKFDYLKVTGDHSDYVGVEESIEPGSEDYNLVSALKYVVKVETGIMVGGVVKNEDGEGVGGADVKIRCRRVDENNRSHTVAEGVVITDGKGNWQFGKIPDVEFKQIRIEVNHSDYVQSTDWVEYLRGDFKLLEAKKFSTVIKKGEVIAGLVTDMNGKAIEGATVMFGTSRYSSDDFVNIETDSEGRFLNDKVKVNEYNMPNIQPGEVGVTVVKAGYAPEMMLVRPKSQSEPLQISLEDGYTITGRVVDVNGEPVAGAWVYADEWRGFRAIEWRGGTDNDGRFKWDGAPADEVKFDFGKKGYSYNRDEALVSSEKEHEIILYPPLKISGKVVDAETGEAIKNFDITHGIDWQRANNNISYQKHTKKSISDPNGKYEWEIVDDYPAHVIKVEADGYISSVSNAFKIEERVGSYDFKLSKAEISEIAVKLPDGSVAVNAEVLVAPGGETIFFEDGYFRDNNGAAVVLSTDADGKFSLSNRDKNFGLVINHEKGFLNMPDEELAGLKEITLQKWGAIQGYIYKGNNPFADQTVKIYCNSSFNSADNVSPRISYNLSAVTDVNGFFEVEKVIAIENVQCSWVKKDEIRDNNFMTKHIKVLPGEVAEIEFLLEGRPVTGRLVVSDELQGKIDFQRSYLNVNSNELEIRKAKYNEIYRKVLSRYMPDGFDDMTVAERIDWSEDFSKSDEVKQMQKDMTESFQKVDLNQISYHVFLKEDGVFFSEGLPSGRCLITGHLMKYNNGSGVNQQSVPVCFEIEVPQGESLYDDNVFDAGDVAVIGFLATKELVGTACPEFSADTADGETVNLSDYRGKYLLLNVSSYGHLTNEAVEQLNGLKEKYSGDDLEILTLSYEQGYRAISKLKEKTEIDWPVVYVREALYTLSDYNVFDISKAFRLNYQNHTANLIISPEGKILDVTADYSEIGNLLEEVFVGL